MAAQFVNRTIDDQYGDEVTGRLVEYSPDADIWSQGNGCGGCALKPDNRSAYDGTWHDGTHMPTTDVEPVALTLKFNGTAIYLYNILIQRTLTDVNITLDGQLASRFTLAPNISDFFEYNFPVFAQTDIPYGEHTVEMSAFGPNHSNILFDYAIYTTNVTTNNTTVSSSSPQPSGQTSPVNSNTSSTSHNSNVGAIVGGAVGGIILVLALLLAFIWHRRSHKEAPLLTPYDARGSARPIFPGENDPGSEDKTVGAGWRKGYMPPPLTHSISEAAWSVEPPSEEVLRQSVQALREQLDAMRPMQTSPDSGPAHSPPSSGPASGEKLSGLASLHSEIDSLRTQIEEIRAQQRQISTQSPPTGPPTADIAREIAMLRAEVDDMRYQQELNQGPLPSYSPPAGPVNGVGVGVER